jgi:hypothetical protein
MFTSLFEKKILCKSAQNFISEEKVLTLCIFDFILMLFLEIFKDHAPE